MGKGKVKTNATSEGNKGRKEGLHPMQMPEAGEQHRGMRLNKVADGHRGTSSEGKKETRHHPRGEKPGETENRDD